MATMGVRINQGLGSASSTALADTLAKALFGDADAAREDALARSRLETDEYTRRQIDSATNWNQVRAEADAAALDAARRGEYDYGTILLEHLNRPNGGSATAPAPTAPPAPVELDDTLLFPDDPPIPSARPEPVAVDPESLLPEEAPIPGLRPASVLAPQGVLPPMPLPLQREPDYGFSGYPMQADGLPELAPIPQPRPVMAEPSMDRAQLDLRPSFELGDRAPIGIDEAEMALKRQLTGLPDELQPVAGPPKTEVAPGIFTYPQPPVAPLQPGLGTATTIPGRLSIQEPPVPVEPPAGPAGAGEVFGPPMPPELAPVDLPPQALAPGYAGTPPVPPVSPVDLPPAEPVVQTPSSVPGTVTPQPDGTAALTMPDGTQKVYTRDQIDGIAAMVAFSNDQAGQARAWTGQLDLLNRGQTAENMALISGQPTPRSSIFGTAEEIKVNDAKAQSEAKYAEPDLKKRIQVIDNIPYELSEGADGSIHYKMGDGFTAPEAPPIPGNTQEIAYKNELILFNRRLNRGEELTDDERMEYNVAYDGAFGPKTTSTTLPDGQQSTQTIIMDPPNDIRTPDALTPGPMTPNADTSSATAPAPAATPAPVPELETAADRIAAETPAVAGTPPTVRTIDGREVPVKNNGGWTNPGEKAPVTRTEVDTGASRVVTTKSGEKKNIQKTDAATNALTHFGESIPAAAYLDSIKPGQEPGIFQTALASWEATGINEAILQNPLLDDATREYGRAILGFINAPKRKEFGAAVNANEVRDYRKRFAMAQGGGNREYLSARAARMQYLKYARMALNGEVNPADLMAVDTDLTKHGLDIDWTIPSGTGAPAAAPVKTGAWVEQPDGTWEQE